MDVTFFHFICIEVPAWRRFAKHPVRADRAMDLTADLTNAEQIKGSNHSPSNENSCLSRLIC